MPEVTFTKEKLKRFNKAYLKAKKTKNGNDVFVFENRKYVLDYAKY